MQNIRKIFFRDVRALLKHPLALLIAAGLCILPALYAWFNIYSNWDPYGNTGNIRIAVASGDRGYTDADGGRVNVADTVIASLKENKSIAWTAVENQEAAVRGVSDGSYYAAVVFADDFTECMYQGFLNGLARPTVTYYENEKKNAVATKITDTAVSTLENNINEQYISLVVSLLFHQQKDVLQNMEASQLSEEIRTKIRKTKEAAGHFSAAVRSLVQANDKLAASMEGANSDLATIGSNLEHVRQGLSDVPDLQALADRLNAANARAVQSVSDALSQLKQAQRAEVAAQKQACYERFGTGIASARDSLEQLINSLQSLNAATIHVSPGIVLTQLEQQLQSLDAMQQRIASRAETDNAGMLSEMEQQLEQQVQVVQQTLQTTVSQSLARLGSDLQQASAEMSQVAGNIQEDIALLDTILTSSVTAVDLANQSFSGMAADMDNIGGKLDQITEIVDSVSEEQLAQGFLSFMQGNAQEYGEFFAEPVTMQTEAVYPVDNYGSGVAPFYTTLALWVGGVVLVSLIKVKAHTDGIENPRPYELFFGRYLLFLMLAVIQAAITVWGDLYLLHIQCLYPRRFFLAALVTSVTFSLLIYALTISFGDLGKAAIVVLMVLQIAGSSGTYPIEILPRFYQKLYIFFPFPYAINAMREAIAGMYEQDQTLYLLQLSLFAAAALALGLVVRLPFRRFYHFIEQRMEDTEMM